MTLHLAALSNRAGLSAISVDKVRPSARHSHVRTYKYTPPVRLPLRRKMRPIRWHVRRQRIRRRGQRHGQRLPQPVHGPSLNIDCQRSTHSDDSLGSCYLSCRTLRVYKLLGVSNKSPQARPARARMPSRTQTSSRTYSLARCVFEIIAHGSDSSGDLLPSLPMALFQTLCQTPTTISTCRNVVQRGFVMRYVLNNFIRKPSHSVTQYDASKPLHLLEAEKKTSSATNRSVGAFMYLRDCGHVYTRRA